MRLLPQRSQEIPKNHPEQATGDSKQWKARNCPHRNRDYIITSSTPPSISEISFVTDLPKLDTSVVTEQQVLKAMSKACDCRLISSQWSYLKASDTLPLRQPGCILACNTHFKMGPPQTLFFRFGPVYGPTKGPDIHPIPFYRHMCFLMNFVNTTCRPPWPFHPDFTALLLLLFAAPSIISEAKSFGKYQGSNAEVSDGRLSRKVLDGKIRTHLRLNDVSKFQANFYLQINSPTWSPMHRYHSIAKVHNVCFPSTFDAQVLIVHHAITSAKCSTH